MMLRLEKLEKYHVQAIATDFEFLQSHRDAFCKEEVNGYVAMYQDIIAAIGGISLLWDGVAEAWFVLGVKGQEFPYRMAKIVKKMIMTMIEENNLFRLQASICSNDEKAVRFIKWLKFEEEGIMKKFGPDGADYIRYAWVK